MSIVSCNKFAASLVVPDRYGLKKSSSSAVSSFKTTGTATAVFAHNPKRRCFVVHAEIDPSPSGPPSSSNSLSWILGLVISFVLPFLTHKWGPLWVLKNRIDDTVQMAEEVVEVEEEVSGKVEKIAEGIAGDLPEGKLKDLVNMVEVVAEGTAKTAGCFDNAIDKVQEAEAEAEEILESITKPSTEKSRL